MKQPAGKGGTWKGKEGLTTHWPLVLHVFQPWAPSHAYVPGWQPERGGLVGTARTRVAVAEARMAETFIVLV